MKSIVTPEEVPTLVFGTSTTLRPEDVPLHTILAAERKYLRPALGEALCDALTSEEPASHLVAFADDYLKLPTALYVASILLPTIATQVGAAGVVRISGESFRSVDERTILRLVRRMRSDADALLDSATDHLATHPDLFPEYKPSNNIRERISFKGGVVL